MVDILRCIYLIILFIFSSGSSWAVEDPGPIQITSDNYRPNIDDYPADLKTSIHQKGQWLLEGLKNSLKEGKIIAVSDGGREVDPALYENIARTIQEASYDGKPFIHDPGQGYEPYIIPKKILVTFEDLNKEHKKVELFFYPDYFAMEYVGQEFGKPTHIDFSYQAQAYSAFYKELNK